MAKYGMALVMFVVGVFSAMQPSINASLGRRTAPFTAATMNFLVGGCIVLIIALLSNPSTFSAVKGAPLWQLTGGILGAALVSSQLLIVPRLGTALLFASVVAGQLFGGLVVDRFGWFGLQAVALSWPRLLGGGLLLAGVILMIRH